MKRDFRTGTMVLAGQTLLVLVFSALSSLREAYERGGFYLSPQTFVEDLPKRLAGTGWFRFILHPLIATVLGIQGGLADARSGRPPYLSGVLFHRSHRQELLSSGFATVVNLLLMGILLDSLFQWVILGASYPGAAGVVGPVLLVTPYSVARALTNRWTRMRVGGCFGRNERNPS